MFLFEPETATGRFRATSPSKPKSHSDFALMQRQVVPKKTPKIHSPTLTSLLSPNSPRPETLSPGRTFAHPFNCHLRRKLLSEILLKGYPPPKYTVPRRGSIQCGCRHWALVTTGFKRLVGWVFRIYSICFGEKKRAASWDLEPLVWSEGLQCHYLSQKDRARLRVKDLGYTETYSCLFGHASSKS